MQENNHDEADEKDDEDTDSLLSEAAGGEDDGKDEAEKEEVGKEAKEDYEGHLEGSESAYDLTSGIGSEIVTVDDVLLEERQENENKDVKKEEKGSDRKDSVEDGKTAARVRSVSDVPVMCES